MYDIQGLYYCVVFLGLWPRRYTKGYVWGHSEGSCKGCFRGTKFSGLHIWCHQCWEDLHIFWFVYFVVAL